MHNDDENRHEIPYLVPLHNAKPIPWFFDWLSERKRLDFMSMPRAVIRLQNGDLNPAETDVSNVPGCNLWDVDFTHTNEGVTLDGGHDANCYGPVSCEMSIRTFSEYYVLDSVGLDGTVSWDIVRLLAHFGWKVEERITGDNYAPRGKNRAA